MSVDEDLKKTAQENQKQMTDLIEELKNTSKTTVEFLQSADFYTKKWSKDKKVDSEIAELMTSCLNSLKAVAFIGAVVSSKQKEQAEIIDKLVSGT